MKGTFLNTSTWGLGVRRRCCRVPRVVLLAAACAALAGSGTAWGQSCGPGTPGDVTCDPNLRHGNGGRAACDNRCVGEQLSCTGEIFYADQLLDPAVVVSAIDRVHGVQTTPGNLPISQVLGNAACTDSGGACDPLTGANCAFPCLIGPSGKVCTDAPSGLSLPGAPSTGSIVVLDDQYVIQPGDVGNLGNTFEFVNRDLCDSGCSNCPSDDQPVFALSNTVVPDCNDNDPCTNDDCDEGVCSNTSVCLDPAFSCDDNDVCTLDECDDTNPPSCCTHTPIECPERPCFRVVGCDPVDGCLYESVCSDPTFSCDDNDVCTIDECDDTNPPECCTHTPIECPERPCFEIVGCDPTDGCLYESVCSDPAFSCDDNDVCTLDECDDTNPPGCCTHTPIECPERPCFRVVGCDPVDGCLYESVCSDPTFSCDDNDVCTIDECDDTNPPGCCTHTPVECPERPCFLLVGCDPNDGCVYESICTDPPPLFCDDGNVCTIDECDDTVPPGCCTHTPIECPERPCFEVVGCDPIDGCLYESVCSDPNFSCDDDDVCTIDECDDTNPPGCCTYTPIECPERPCYVLVGCDSIEGCVYESVCVIDPDYCDDGDPCTEDICDPGLEGCCEHVPICGEEICRTPGFWGTHACGTDGVTCEKDRSSNITQTVIDNCGGCMEVCGDIIDTTVLDDADSALEAICVRIKGRKILQLVRHLTAAALNCCISDSDDTCGGVSVEPIYTACNAACAGGETTASVGGHSVDCVNAIDCFNNGGRFDVSTGLCQTGICSDNGAPCNEDDRTGCADPLTATCDPLPDNCHERLFGICSDGTLCDESNTGADGNRVCDSDGSPCRPGPAGSSKACNDANRNRCNAFDSTVCGMGDNGPETCDSTSTAAPLRRDRPR